MPGVWLAKHIYIYIYTYHIEFPVSYYGLLLGLHHWTTLQVTYHVLYNAAAAEAKLRMAGAKDISAAASWARVTRLQGELRDVLVGFQHVDFSCGFDGDLRNLIGDIVRYDMTNQL